MSMMNNGISGMNAASLSLIVTSNNIANASVPGYSRQQAMFTTTPTGSVHVSEVRRITDDFYVSQVQQSSTSLGYATTYASQAQMLEQTLSSDSMSLSPVLNDFFQSLNAAQADPMDVAYRQQILSDAGNLAAQFNMLSGRIDDQLGDIDTQLETMTSEANALMKQLADLNSEIMKQEAAGGASAHLLDQRDQAVQQLSELVGMEVVYQSDNTVDLFLPNGEALVVGGSANELTLLSGDPDPSMTQIGLKSASHVKALGNVGGAIQGQLDFRDETLIPARQELDRMALVLVDAINSQLEEGYDLNGDSGSPLFGDINGTDSMRSRSTSSSNNTGNGVLEVGIADSTKLTADNYKITVGEDGLPVVTTEPGGEEVEYKMTSTGEISFDGLTVSLAEGELQPGDSFFIEPGKSAAADINVILDDPEKLAFSSDPDEPGNNDNLKALADIQNENLVGGRHTVNGAYNSLVIDVAGKTAAAMTDYEASMMIYQTANNSLMSVAGVSMDEEAANLIVFQQAYAANAKVISTADDMFNLLLGL